MTDGNATELREKLDALGIEHFDFDKGGRTQTIWESPDRNCNFEYETFDNEATTSKLTISWFPTPEQAIAATLGSEPPKKCSTCQYRYCVGQRPYPPFGYRCGFGDSKKLCGNNTSVLDHMCCEHWEKELR
jgi:hypothetical protein